VRLVGTQRHALVAGLAAPQRAALTARSRGFCSRAWVLRLQADFVLEACARYWNATKGHHECQGLAIAGGVGLAHAGLEKEYGQGAGLMGALDGVELDVASGETLAVMSPSGCGSRRCCICLEAWNAPRWGEVWLAGHRIDQLSEKALARLRRRAIGFVFQAFHLMDELTALENVELPALLAGSSPRAARRRAAELLEQVGLSDRAEHLPSALSGGQRQVLWASGPMSFQRGGGPIFMTTMHML
jgi:ABC-type multidrug transport system fused ATPase/permease subunit